MRRSTLISMLGLAVLFAVDACELRSAEVVWQIGQPDRAYGEFAVAANWGAFADQFNEPPVFVVGEDDPAKDWPFIHPGPVDQWAGARRHSFEIQFNLSEPMKPYYELQLKLVWLAPLVPLGAWIGKRIVYRINKTLFERIIMVFLLISGLLLLLR